MENHHFLIRKLTSFQWQWLQWFFWHNQRVYVYIYIYMYLYDIHNWYLATVETSKHPLLQCLSVSGGIKEHGTSVAIAYCFLWLMIFRWWSLRWKRLVLVVSTSPDQNWWLQRVVKPRWTKHSVIYVLFHYLSSETLKMRWWKIYGWLRMSKNPARCFHAAFRKSMNSRSMGNAGTSEPGRMMLRLKMTSDK